MFIVQQTGANCLTVLFSLGKLFGQAVAEPDLPKDREMGLSAHLCYNILQFTCFEGKDIQTA